MYGDPGSLTVMRIVKQEKDDHIPTRKDFKKELHKEWEKSEISVDKWLLAEVDLAVVRSVRRGTVHWVRCLLCGLHELQDAAHHFKFTQC